MKRVLCLAVLGLLAVSTAACANEIELQTQAFTVRIPVNYIATAKIQHHIVIKNDSDEARYYNVTLQLCAPNFPCETKSYTQSVPAHASYDSGVIQLIKRISYPYKVKTSYAGSTTVNGTRQQVNADIQVMA